MRRFDFIVTCVCFTLLGYFAWHAWKGPRGYPYQESLQGQVASLELKYQSHRAVRERMEHKVNLLRPENIDPDMLDEMARGKLELVKPTDVIAFTER